MADGMAELFIDADACPVKSECFKVAARYQVKSYQVSNGGMRPSRDPLIENVIVSKEPDAADDWIATHVRSGDIVVTADIPLASRCLEAGCQVIAPTGREFTGQNIGQALASRELSQHLREVNQSQTYHAPFGAKDRSNFLQVLDRVLQRACKEAPAR